MGNLSLFWCLLQFLCKQDGFITALPSRLKHLGRKILRAGGSWFQGNHALAEAGKVTEKVPVCSSSRSTTHPPNPTAWRGKKEDGQGHKVPLLAKNLLVTDNSWEREKPVFFNISVTNHNVKVSLVINSTPGQACCSGTYNQPQVHSMGYLFLLFFVLLF